MAEYVMNAGRQTPDKIALRVLDPDGVAVETWRYADLDRAIRGTAAGLRQKGVRPGDRVMLRVANSSAFPILFFGTIAAGAIAVATSAQLTRPEVLALIADAKPRFLAVSEALEIGALPDDITPLQEAEWDVLRLTDPGGYNPTERGDPAYLIYTSGTSGKPKGVLHAHRAAWARRMMWQGWYGLQPSDLMLHAGAFNWTYTLGTGLTDPWAAGASSLVMAQPPTPDKWAGIAARHEATLFAAVPGVYRQILKAPGDLSHPLASLRHGLTAGERLPDPLALEWQSRTGKPLFEALGMSEISTFISSSPTVPRQAGSCGRPQRGRRVAVLTDDGEITPRDTPGHLAISTDDPGLMLGYWNGSGAALESADWFVTGDRARMDAQGYVTHLGRADDLITAQGYRISPFEVEEVLQTHPDIAEVAVTGITPRPGLTLLAAFVVAHGEIPDDQLLADFAAKALAPYKIPHIWHAVETLPRTANGKLQRRHLAEIYRSTQG